MQQVRKKLRINIPAGVDTGTRLRVANEGNAGQEEEYKGTVDFDKVPLQEKNFIPTIYDDENYEFKVVKPQLHGSHIVYNVQGVDKQGPFEGVRRYNHFYCLYEAL